MPLRFEGNQDLIYGLGAKPGSARTASGWNVIVPVDVAERGFDWRPRE